MQRRTPGIAAHTKGRTVSDAAQGIYFAGKTCRGLEAHSIELCYGRHYLLHIAAGQHRHALSTRCSYSAPAKEQSLLQPEDETMDKTAKRRQLAEQLRAKGVDLDAAQTPVTGIARISERDLDTVVGGEFYAYIKWTKGFGLPTRN
jgi:hypothetical protein